MSTLLTIAGFDPSSGAGVTADLATFAAHGHFGISTITALTVQSTVGVRRSSACDAGLVAETLACLAEDLPPAGIKIGMLATAGIVEVVAEFLERIPRVPVVLDPVIRSSSGRELLEAEGIELMRQRLLPRVSWVTPNLAELAWLLGRPLLGAEAMAEAAAELAGAYAGLWVAVTGGDLERADDFIVRAGDGGQWLRGEKIVSDATHGTGCAFSSALLCGLVAGLDPLHAAAEAKRYVAGAIAHAEPRGQGKGPMNLLWPLTGQVGKQ